MRKNKLFSLLLAVVMILGSVGFAFAEVPADGMLATLTGVTDILIAPAPKTDYTNKVVILHSNDVHGSVAGYAYMAALKADYEAKGAKVILADAGDFSQGTTYVSVSKGLSAVELMNAVGYDVAIPGNHEFDYGYDSLVSNLKQAKFKFICANIYMNGKEAWDPYTIIEKGGVKVAFVGVDTPEAQTKVNPALIKGMTVLSEFSENNLFTRLQAVIDEAKAKADVVILLSHLGVDDESVGHQSYDAAKKLTGYDFIIDAHSHTVMTEGENGEKMQSTGTAFDNIGVIVIDGATKKIVSNELVDFEAATIDTAAKTVAYPEGASYDKTVAAAAEKVIAEILTEYGAKFAESKVALNGAKSGPGNRDSETNNGDLITDAMVWAATKDGALKVDADHIVAITNGGGIRAAIAVGDVTKNDVNTVLPFGNTVATVYVSGAELLEALEASTYSLPDAVGGFPQVAGIDFTVNTAAKYDANKTTYPGSTYFGPNSIKRVTINNINGKDFSLTDTYAVVTNNFCAAGGDTYYAFAAATDQFDTGIPLDEALMDYIKSELGGVIGEKYANPADRIGIHPFADVVTGAWYEQFVADLYTNGTIGGTSETTFSPSANLKRADLVTMLWRMEGQPVVNYAMSYTDVDASSYYGEAVRWATSEKLVGGYGDGLFGPSDYITREQLATVLYNYAKHEGIDVAKATENTNTLSYDDIFTVSSWATEGVHWSIAAGIINGSNGNVLPLANASRAEAATMLYRFTALQ